MSFKTTDPCLAKAGIDEPIFVLRSTDELAPFIVDTWAQVVRVKAAEHLGTEQAGKMFLKAAEAADCARQMREWQRRHGCKLPD